MEAMARIKGLSEGRTCHYVAFNHRHLAAMVIGGEGEKADLVVFTNMTNVAGLKNYGMQFHTEVQYNEDLAPGTWHWITCES